MLWNGWVLKKINTYKIYNAMVDFGANIYKCLRNEINDGKTSQKKMFLFLFQKQKKKKPNNNLPSVSKATSLLRGAHRPHLIGVGVKARSNG